MVDGGDLVGMELREAGDTEILMHMVDMEATVIHMEVMEGMEADGDPGTEMELEER